MAAYLKYDVIPKGESLADGHKGSDGWIELGSVQFGAGRSISTPTGASSKREASAPTISELVATKLMDSVSPLLFQALVKGQNGKAVVELTETHDQKLETYLTVTMENTMVSSYSVSSGGDRPSESFSLNFTKIEYKYQGYDDAHKPDSSKKAAVTFDLAQAKAS
jgi:type VI secretion system secreted protein Hcp